jgi:hypothetical protein
MRRDCYENIKNIPAYAIQELLRGSQERISDVAAMFLYCWCLIWGLARRSVVESSFDGTSKFH